MKVNLSSAGSPSSSQSPSIKVSPPSITPPAPTPPGAFPTFGKLSSAATWALIVFVLAAVSMTKSRLIPVLFFSMDFVASLGKRRARHGYG